VTLESLCPAVGIALFYSPAAIRLKAISRLPHHGP
jgi:hypothetical protein